MNSRGLLDKIGNIGRYTPQEHHVISHEPIHVPKLAYVKMYTLEPHGSAILHPLIEDAKDRVAEKIRKNEIAPKMGLGFAILSPGILNVSMWGGRYPSLVTPHIYPFSSNRDLRRNLVRQKASQAEAYCAWEVAILGHEAHAWRRYLFSKHKERDVWEYLEDTFEGKIKIKQHHDRYGQLG